MEILTPREAEILSMARYILDDVANRANDLATGDLLMDSAPSTLQAAARARDLGKVVAASTIGEYGIFQALVNLKVYADDEVASAVVHTRTDPASETPFGPAEAAEEVVDTNG